MSFDSACSYFLEMIVGSQEMEVDVSVWYFMSAIDSNPGTGSERNYDSAYSRGK